MLARTLLYLERLPLLARRPLVVAGLTVLICLAALGLRVALDPLVGGGLPFITFFPTVLLCSLLFGWRSGVIATIMCALLAWFALIEPLGGFGFDRNAIAAVSLFAVISASEIFLIQCLQSLIAQLSAEREISRALAETRLLLFGELQHRVSNNLQIAASLLALQKRKVTDMDARAALDEASERIGLIGRISRQLYDAEGGVIGMARFLKGLCADVVSASGRTDLRCAIDAEGDIALPSDSAIPVALIFTEAVSNAIEHGFADREGGSIEVTLKRIDANRIELCVSDDGHGLAEGFSIDRSDSLGLRIATMLARQMGGTFRLDGANGTRAMLSIKG